jgi:hypothetical protein
LIQINSKQIIKLGVSFDSRNRLLPRYINIATTRYNKLAGMQHNLAQKKKERKKRETNADTSKSTKQR